MQYIPTNVSINGVIGSIYVSAQIERKKNNKFEQKLRETSRRFREK